MRKGNRIKVSRYFYLDELVPEEVYRQFGARAIEFLDHRAVNGLDFIRSGTGYPIIVNNWWKEGQYNYSGYRPPNCSVGAKFSQHKYGRGFDLKSKGLTPPELREWLRDISHAAFLTESGMITTIEQGTETWTHIDNRHNENQSWTLREIPYWRKTA